MNGTPAFYINQRRHDASFDYEILCSAIERNSAWNVNVPIRHLADFKGFATENRHMTHVSASSTRDSISDIWGPRTPPVGNEWPVRVDQHTTEAPDRWVQSACVLCSNGCGMDIGVKDDTPGGRIVGVRGRAVDVVNHGRLGPKGLHG